MLAWHCTKEVLGSNFNIGNIFLELQLRSFINRTQSYCDGKEASQQQATKIHWRDDRPPSRDKKPYSECEALRPTKFSGKELTGNLSQIFWEKLDRFCSYAISNVLQQN
jgi:hypothetical protein